MPAIPSPSAAFRATEADPSPTTDLSRPFLAGATLILAATAVVTMFARTSTVDPSHAEDIRTVAGTSTALCAFAVFALSRATWRQIGDRAALWAGCGALVIGVAAASRPELLGALFGDRAPDDRWLAAVAAAGLTVAPLLFGAGLVPRLEKLRVGAASLTAAAMLAVGALSIVFHALPRLGTSLSVFQLTAGDGAGSVAAGTLVVGFWLALAVGYTVRGLRRRWLYTWAGLMLFALTLSGLSAGGGRTGNAWAVGAALLEALGVVLALVGSHLELTRAYEDQTLKLWDSTLEAETAEVRERVRVGAYRARRHDLVNAIMAIDGAAMILEREFERLTPSDRETLAGVVGSGTARLRRLLAQEGGAEAPVSLAEAATNIADDSTWRGKLKIDVPVDLLAVGSPAETEEAVRQLVDYATQRSPDSPVTLRGERDGDWVVLRVEDDGATMPRELRRSVTSPDGRREPGGEDAMGVRVAARLMRGQGGDLWVEARSGGGTSFGICLPAVAAASGDAGAADA